MKMKRLVGEHTEDRPRRRSRKWILSLKRKRREMSRNC